MEEAGGLVRDSESIRNQVDELLNAQQDDFDRQYTKNDEELKDLNDEVQRLDDKIIDLNEAVSLKQEDKNTWSSKYLQSNLTNEYTKFWCQ